MRTDRSPPARPQWPPIRRAPPASASSGGEGEVVRASLADKGIPVKIPPPPRCKPRRNAARSPAPRTSPFSAPPLPNPARARRRSTRGFSTRRLLAVGPPPLKTGSSRARPVHLPPQSAPPANRTTPPHPALLPAGSFQGRPPSPSPAPAPPRRLVRETPPTMRNRRAA